MYFYVCDCEWSDEVVFVRMYQEEVMTYISFTYVSSITVTGIEVYLSGGCCNVQAIIFWLWGILHRGYQSLRIQAIYNGI